MTDKSKGSRGFTLLELVVTLVIIGIILALAVPRYLGFRRNALVAEADTLLAEVKTLAWAYYQQHGSWVGITTATMPAALGFEAPDGGLLGLRRRRGRHRGADSTPCHGRQPPDQVPPRPGDDGDAHREQRRFVRADPGVSVSRPGPIVLLCLEAWSSQSTL